ncbi:MAG: hypothetical protein PHP35_00385 [Candidatus Colwellbacteria bacterium]|nr:hypothetical protein [Candidatus Colwellbacteria bacterium]
MNGNSKLKQGIRIKKEAIYLTINAVFLILILAAAISVMGFVANEIADAISPNASGVSPAPKFDLEGYKSLDLRRVE